MRAAPTEELFASTALLDDLNQPWLQLLNCGNVVGENTHLSRLGRYVDLHTKLDAVSRIALTVGRGAVGETYTSVDL